MLNEWSLQVAKAGTSLFRYNCRPLIGEFDRDLIFLEVNLKQAFSETSGLKGLRFSKNVFIFSF